MNSNLSYKQGFSIIELITVVAIIMLLTSIAMLSFNQFKMVSRDIERVAQIQKYALGLELYKNDFAHYPPAGGYTGTNMHTIRSVECSIPPNWYEREGGIGYGIRIDNSHSSGFLKPLYPEYIDGSTWADPLGGITGSGQGMSYNCQYIIPATEYDCACEDMDGTSVPGCESCGDDMWWQNNYPQYVNACTSSRCPHPETYQQIQKYYLHCLLESDFETSKSDGGSVSWVNAGDYLYEIYAPEPWLCVRYIPCHDNYLSCPDGQSCVGSGFGYCNWE